MIRRISNVFLVAVGLAFAHPVQGQGQSAADRVRIAYERLDFELALASADSVIRSSESSSPEDLVEVHTIAALVYVARNQPRNARQHFASIVSIDPDLELDPMLASPQALELFREVQSEARTRQVDNVMPSVRYLRVYDPRPSAAYRSMVLPGWGQLYKGHRTRGYAMMGIWASTVAGTVAAHIVRNSRRDAYLNETDPLAVAGRFDEYNRWHKARNNLAIAAAATWVVSYLDALIFEGTARPGTSRRASVGLSHDAHDDPGTPSLSLRFPLR